jgi:hypothetical protein
VFQIRYDRKNRKARKVTRFLKRKIKEIAKRDPAIIDDFIGLKRVVVETKPGSGCGRTPNGQFMAIGGEYDRADKIVTIYINNLVSKTTALMVLLHELGHHVRWQSGKAKDDYDAFAENESYYIEEILAKKVC